MVIRLVVVLMLIGSLAEASPLSTRDSMVYYVQRETQLATDNDIVPTALIRGILNRKILEFTGGYNVIEKLDTITSNIDSTDYALNDDFLRLAQVVKKNDTMLVPLEYSIVDEIFARRNGLEGLLPDLFDVTRPRYAWTSKGRLFMVPISQQTETFIVTYFARGEQVTTGSGVIALPDEYLEPLLYLVCAEVQHIRRETASEAAFMSRFIHMMGEPLSRSGVGVNADGDHAGSHGNQNNTTSAVSSPN